MDADPQPAGAAAPMLTRITATIVLDFVTDDDEELDTVCENIHEALGMMMVAEDWTGTVELTLVPLAPDGGAAGDAEAG